MNIVGKTTIHPILFYSGKLLGYSTWGVLFYKLCNTQLIPSGSLHYNHKLSLLFVLVGLIISTLSIFNLGSSTQLGLPEESTTFKTKGLYKFSRNPMYVGFNLLTLSAMIYTLNGWIILLGIYSIFIYHLIILGEEKFMVKRFGNEYQTYKQKTGRYISFIH